jgi:hypothetical protein
MKLRLFTALLVTLFTLRAYPVGSRTQIIQLGKKLEARAHRLSEEVSPGSFEIQPPCSRVMVLLGLRQPTPEALPNLLGLLYDGEEEMSRQWADFRSWAEGQLKGQLPVTNRDWREKWLSFLILELAQDRDDLQTMRQVASRYGRTPPFSRKYREIAALGWDEDFRRNYSLRDEEMNHDSFGHLILAFHARARMLVKQFIYTHNLFEALEKTGRSHLAASGEEIRTAHAAVSRRYEAWARLRSGDSGQGPGQLDSFRDPNSPVSVTESTVLEQARTLAENKNLGRFFRYHLSRSLRLYEHDWIPNRLPIDPSFVSFVYHLQHLVPAESQ